MTNNNTAGDLWESIDESESYANRQNNISRGAISNSGLSLVNIVGSKNESHDYVASGAAGRPITVTLKETLNPINETDNPKYTEASIDSTYRTTFE